MTACQTPALPSPAMSLSDRDRQILAIELERWRFPGSKEEAIRDVLDVTPSRYYQLLGQLLERPEALAAEPVLVNRLRRLRGRRTAARWGLAN